MTIHEKLLAVQSALKAPKGQTNAFGKYKYRSCEDILEAVKPLLKEHGIVLILSDSIEHIGSRFYVKATATVHGFTDHPTTKEPLQDYVSVTAYAREEDDKKGMDGAQITGAASSYARKYALNGLFCIDDTKDADAINDHAKAPPKVKEAAPKPEPEPAPLELLSEIQKVTEKLGGSLVDVYRTYKVTGRPSKVLAEQILSTLKDKEAKLSKQLNTLSQQ